MTNRCLCGLVAGVALAASGEEAARLELSAGGRVAALYQAAPNPLKPYVKELFTPSGVQVLLDSPSDHVHHHGLMFAVAAGGTDFWAEQPAAKFGTQIPRAGETKAAAESVRQSLDWTTPAGTVVLREARAVRVLEPAAGGPSLLTWRTELTAPAGGPAVSLAGSHYFGLGLRLHPDLNGRAEFLSPGAPTGTTVRGDERLTAGRWCAVRGAVGGKPVTVAMFDHPGNPRAPATWFTMGKPFAYLSATLGLARQPLPLEAGTPLLLRYGVAAWDGAMTPEAIEQAAARWVASER